MADGNEGRELLSRTTEIVASFAGNNTVVTRASAHGSREGTGSRSCGSASWRSRRTMAVTGEDRGAILKALAEDEGRIGARIGGIEARLLDDLPTHA